MNITYLSNGLRLVGLLGVVCGNAFGFKLLSLSILILIRSEKIDIIIAGLLFLLLSGSGSGLTSEDGTGAARTGEGGELSLIGFDMFVPAGDVGVSQILGKSLEDGNVSLRWGVTNQQRERLNQFRSLGQSVDMNTVVEGIDQMGWK